MTAILLKDVLTLKNQLKTIGIIIAIYVLFFQVLSEGFDNMSFVTMLIVLMCITLTISAFSYDDICKWENYALAMPITKNQMVQSRYILGILFTLFGCLLSFVFDVIFKVIRTGSPAFTMEEGIIYITALCTALMILTIMLPLVYKFGASKGRIALFAVIMVPICVAVILARTNLLPSFTEEQIEPLLKIAPAIVLLLFIGSYFLSTSFYKKKEF